MFLVPELVIPRVTGVWFGDDETVCEASQSQPIPQLNGFDMGYFVGWFMIAVPWAIIALFTCLTIWKLCGHKVSFVYNELKWILLQRLGRVDVLYY